MAGRVQKIRIFEDRDRRIGTSELNIHVAKGMNVHRQSTLAPAGMLQPLTKDREVLQMDRQKAVLRQLRSVIGEPAYSAPGFVLYNRDCLASLEALSSTDFKIDLTLTSPPYNIGKEYEKSLDVQEYVDWCAQWMDAIHAVTDERGSLWLNLGYLEVPMKGLCVPISYLLWDRSPFYLIQELVWMYGAGVSAKSRLSPRNEKWLFYVRDSKNYTFNLDEIRDPNVKYPNQKKNGKFRCNPLGKNPGDVWDIPKITTGEKRSSQERTSHPAQFPLSLVERITKVGSNPGQVVVDPFAGSCSAGIAAASLGRVFVGFELREDYCEMAAKRYESFVREKAALATQQSIF
jgi:adenine-specific DNA-methyltransferase